MIRIPTITTSATPAPMRSGAVLGSGLDAVSAGGWLSAGGACAYAGAPNSERLAAASTSSISFLFMCSSPGGARIQEQDSTVAGVYRPRLNLTTSEHTSGWLGGKGGNAAITPNP